MIVFMFYSVVLYINWIGLRKQIKILTSARDRELSLRKSSEVRLGLIAEQMAPFLEKFKHDPKKAKFLGMPIDYIIFEDDKIYFTEIKSGKAKLTDIQKNIKDIIERGDVKFETIRID